MNSHLDEYLKISTILKDKIELLRNSRILITGATGLIGLYLTNYLIYLNDTQHYKIELSVITRNESKARNIFKNKKINVIKQDLNESFNLTDKFDYIIHAASNAHPLAFSIDPVGTMKTNLLGTISLLELAKKCNSKFLYLSTGEIYGNNTYAPFVENDCGNVDSKNVRSCYPESKRAAETLCVSYHKQFQISTNIARLCYIYGPTITDENSRADAQFLRNAIEGNDIVLKSEGLQKRTYCYVADAVSAILHILLGGFNGEVFNVANPNSIVSIKEFAKLLANIAKVELRFEQANKLEKSGYSKPLDSILNANKLIDTGWKPLYSLKDGLTRTFITKKESVTNV